MGNRVHERVTFTLFDKEVRFVTKLGEVEIERKFPLEPMMFGDALAM